MYFQGQVQQSHNLFSTPCTCRQRFDQLLLSINQWERPSDGIKITFSQLKFSIHCDVCQNTQDYQHPIRINLFNGFGQNQGGGFQGTVSPQLMQYQKSQKTHTQGSNNYLRYDSSPAPVNLMQSELSQNKQQYNNQNIQTAQFGLDDTQNDQSTADITSIFQSMRCRDRSQSFEKVHQITHTQHQENKIIWQNLNEQIQSNQLTEIEQYVNTNEIRKNNNKLKQQVVFKQPQGFNFAPGRGEIIPPGGEETMQYFPQNGGFPTPQSNNVNRSNHFQMVNSQTFTGQQNFGIGSSFGAVQQNFPVSFGRQESREHQRNIRAKYKQSSQKINSDESL